MPEMTLNGLIHNRYDNQSKMATAMGWSRQRLNKILNGKKKPNLEEVDMIARALGVPFATAAQFFLVRQSPVGDPFDFLARK